MSALSTLAQGTVTTAGTKVAVSATTGPRWRAIRIEAPSTNAGAIFVGDLNVSSTRYSYRLTAGQGATISGTGLDASKLYVDAATNGDKFNPSVMV
jgi:hypothetical protein